MSAHLKLHVKTEEVSREVLKEFFSNSIGSEFFGARSTVGRKEAFDKIAGTPGYEVGPVSNLKATMSGDDDKYRPGPIQIFQDYFGAEPREVTEELVEEIRDEIENSSNDSIYEDDNIDVEGSLEFLEENVGEKIFIVSW